MGNRAESRSEQPPKETNTCLLYAILRSLPSLIHFRLFQALLPMQQKIKTSTWFIVLNVFLFALLSLLWVWLGCQYSITPIQFLRRAPIQSFLSICNSIFFFRTHCLMSNVYNSICITCNLEHSKA